VGSPNRLRAAPFQRPARERTRNPRPAPPSRTEPARSAAFNSFTARLAGVPPGPHLPKSTFPEGCAS